jgi:ribosome-associated heat shock protein Hsp15
LRLDLFLKNICLAKSRSMAGKAIDEGRVTVNGARVKASREVRVGDVFEIAAGRTCRTLKVLDVPSGQLSKALSKDYYSVLGEKRLADDLW